MKVKRPLVSGGGPDGAVAWRTRFTIPSSSASRKPSNRSCTAQRPMQVHNERWHASTETRRMHSQAVHHPHPPTHQ